MESKQYKAAIEAILFAAGEPFSLDRLVETLEADAETGYDELIFREKA